MKLSTFFISAMAALAAADTCKLTAYSMAVSSIDLGGFSISGSDGFIMQINDLVPHQKMPTEGNGYPPNYGCPGDPQNYGYAHFDSLWGKNIGMCIENVDFLPAGGFDCQGLGGKKFKGVTSKDFFGVGNTLNTKCTVVWDC